MNYIFSNYPYLQATTSYTTNYYSINTSNISTDYYKFIFDSRTIVVVEIADLIMNIYTYI